jgi:hypothetical protein
VAALAGLEAAVPLRWGGTGEGGRQPPPIVGQGCYTVRTVAPAASSRNRRRRRVRLVALVGVVLVAAPLTAAVALSGSASAPPAPGAAAQSSSAPSTTTTASPSTAAPTTAAPATSAPAPADVAAARACAAFTTYLTDAGQGNVPKADGQAVTNDAYQLVAGASQAQAAGKPLPKWATLGENLIAATDDIVNRDSTALSKDGTAAAKACQTIPDAARVAGGYVGSAPSPTTTG